MSEKGISTALERMNRLVICSDNMRDLASKWAMMPLKRAVPISTCKKTGISWILAKTVSEFAGERVTRHTEDVNEIAPVRSSLAEEVLRMTEDIVL